MEFQQLLSYVRRAVQDYDMISDGDRILVGVSGGKDSLALVRALRALSDFYPKKFTICAATIDMGFENTDFEAVNKYCAEIGVEHSIIKTELGKLIFDVRKEHNPCALCSNMRRGALVNACKASGANKLALGHHMDDIVDTFLLNLLYIGKIETFQPVTFLDRSGVTVIRPLIYVQEKKLNGYINKYSVPVMKSPCPADKKTSREDVKRALNLLSESVPGMSSVKVKIFGAIKKSGINGYHE
ncbi:tRNA-cytidine(32) 2-sulfurtransferase [bioreactor metagenome]|uniref:tRNA-cytidine(32) 2-sulfurtransferase n=1 Tax=bioreactor metagenome TaxID=1076179 RepID=A0A645EJV6_9ZZZZ|nr:ATP-binding protein [Oscillospiraceae bacterium]